MAKTMMLAEFKGAIREVEVYPGQIAEWWFVPVGAGRVTDLRCGIVGSDGKSHAEHGMTGEIVIERPLLPSLTVVAAAVA